MLAVDGQARLTLAQVEQAAQLLEPKVKVALNGELRTFAGLINLERLSEKTDAFHRSYRGQHPTRRDRVILHLYDLSASADHQPLELARREFDTLQRWQKLPFVPSLLDSFQDADGYVAVDFGAMTPYVALELLTGGLAVATPSSDVYALCATLATLFTSDDPLAGTARDVLARGCRSSRQSGPRWPNWRRRWTSCKASRRPSWSYSPRITGMRTPWRRSRIPATKFSAGWVRAGSARPSRWWSWMPIPMSGSGPMSPRPCAIGRTAKRPCGRIARFAPRPLTPTCPPFTKLPRNGGRMVLWRC
ncbi:MAG: hypothetical protein LM550_09340 [Candidatus Contendobacter sp.]|nr:hypothetical protein [Candidatus Contendobacter sp.]